MIICQCCGSLETVLLDTKWHDEVLCRNCKTIQCLGMLENAQIEKLRWEMAIYKNEMLELIENLKKEIESLKCYKNK